MPGDRAVSDEYPDDLDSVVLGQRLVAARKAAPHRTQLAMAVEIGVSMSAYTSWEQGRHRPHPRELRKIIEVTGFSEDYFLGKADH